MRIFFTFFLILFASFATIAKADTSLPFEIRGITGAPLNNVLTHLEIAEQSYGPELSSENRREFIQNAPENIRKALEPYGYFKAEVTHDIVNHKIIFYINPGHAIKITDIEIKISGPGKDNSDLQAFITYFPLTSGQVLLSEEYEKAKEKLFQLLNDQGYIKAILEKKEIRIDLKNDSAEIILHLNTGARYYFGQVKFSSSPFAQSFLKRFVPFKENEPFSSQKLLKFKQDLSNSKFFSKIEASPDFEKVTDAKIPIDVAVTAPKSQRYDIGLGYGTFTGARLTLGTELRRVTDTGQHLSAQLKLSSVLSRLSAKYYIPGKNPLTDQYIIGANVQHFAPKNGTSFSQTLSGSYQKFFDDWQSTIGINYLNERYKVEEKPTHMSQVFYPSFNISRMKADNIISPQFGSMINFTIQGASQDVLSKTNFFQTEIKAKYIFSPTNHSRMILRGDLGYTIVENLNQLPLTLRYFAGGLGTVRGYPFDSIGPGKYLEVASAEFQHRIYGDWFGAAFYDIGNASDTFNGNFNRGDGVGLIYQSYIGPIKMYVGRGLSKPGKPLSFELSIGPDF